MKVFVVKINSFKVKNMKKLLIIVLLCTCISHVNGQTKKQKEFLESIKNEWALDDNRNLTYVKIVNDIPVGKDEIFNRILSYITHTYQGSKDVVEVNDKESGRIIAKGKWPVIETFSHFPNTYQIGAEHIIQFDVKENRMRVILTIPAYYGYMQGMTFAKFRDKVADVMPINKECPNFRKMYTKAFISLHLVCQATLLNIEKSVREGNTSSEIENDNW